MPVYVHDCSLGPFRFFQVHIYPSPQFSLSPSHSSRYQYHHPYSKAKAKAKAKAPKMPKPTRLDKRLVTVKRVLPTSKKRAGKQLDPKANPDSEKVMKAFNDEKRERGDDAYLKYGGNIFDALKETECA